MHAPILPCISQHTKFQVPSLTNSKDMIRAKFKKRVTWPWPRPVGDVSDDNYQYSFVRDGYFTAYILYTCKLTQTLTSISG